MAQYLELHYETGDNNYQHPEDLRPNFEGLGIFYSRCPNDHTGGAEHSFFSGGFAGRVYSEGDHTYRDPKLNMDIVTAFPLGKAQSDAVTLLLLKLPMFKEISRRTISVPTK